MRSPLSTLVRLLRGLLLAPRDLEQLKLLHGQAVVREMLRAGPYANIHDSEIGVFSQWGDDGIIQYLVSLTEPLPDSFIEFGVEDYREANTRFLLLNNNWRGLVFDGSERNIAAIRSDYQYWRHGLRAMQAFVTRENIDELITTAGHGGEVGLLSIDIDGNDYWVWEAIKSIEPVIVVVEYNSVFGPERALTVPYQADFSRNEAHSSNLFYGASLAALHHLGERKGHALVGCNSAGNNAYFVRRDRLRPPLRGLTPGEAFVESRFRDSRDRAGRLTYLEGQDRLLAIASMKVWDIVLGELVAVG